MLPGILPNINDLSVYKMNRHRRCIALRGNVDIVFRPIMFDLLLSQYLSSGYCDFILCRDNLPMVIIRDWE